MHNPYGAQVCPCAYIGSDRNIIAYSPNTDLDVRHSLVGLCKSQKTVRPTTTSGGFMFDSILEPIPLKRNRQSTVSSDWKWR
jgi:hypothetical protein